MSDTPQIYSDTVNYKPVDTTLSRYRYLRLPLNNLNGSSFSISNTQIQLAEFKMPIAVYNLGQAILSYDPQFGAATNPGYNWSYEDCASDISWLYFGNASGLDMCSLYGVNKYTKVARKINTKLMEYLGNDNLQGLYPSNIPASQNLQAVPTNIQAGNIYGIPANPSYYGGLVNFMEPDFTYQSALEKGASESGINRPKMIPLGQAFPNTFVGMNRDSYFGMDMYLRLNFGPGTNVGFNCTSNVAPTYPAGNTANLNSNINYNNVYLYLPIEQNPLIVDRIIGEFRAGSLKMLIPYTTMFRNPSIGSVANIQIQLTSQYGRRLKQIMHTVWNNASGETQNLTYDCNNWNGRQLATYNTYLNNVQLQDQLLSCSQPNGIGYLGAQGSTPNPGIIGSDDFRENAQFLKIGRESSVIQNYGQYQQNWFHMDRFYFKQESSTPDDNVEEGYDLRDPAHNVVIWQIQANMATTPAPQNPNSNYVHYTFATFQRMLHFSPNGAYLD